MDRDAAVEAAVEIAGAAFQVAGRAAAVFASSAWRGFNVAYDMLRDYVQSSNAKPVEWSSGALDDGWEDI